MAPFRLLSWHTGDGGAALAMPTHHAYWDEVTPIIVAQTIFKLTEALPLLTRQEEKLCYSGWYERFMTQFPYK